MIPHYLDVLSDTMFIICSIIAVLFLKKISRSLMNIEKKLDIKKKPKEKFIF